MSPKPPFPLHTPLHDAHCHPTDIPSSLAALRTMRARCLTIMATRAEDQALVAQAAEQYGVKSADWRNWGDDEKVLPAWGWHPWFAHLVWVDGGLGGGEGEGAGRDEDEKEKESENGNENEKQGQDQDQNQEHPVSPQREGEQSTQPSPVPLTGAQKLAHYISVLPPKDKSSSSSPTLTPLESAIYDALPPPTPLSTLLAQTEKYLRAHPYALVGEVGLDRSFRVPLPWSLVTSASASSPTSTSNSNASEKKNGEEEEGLTPGTRAARPLSPFRCAPAHQRIILQQQLRLAGKLGRAASVHGVQAHGMLFEALRELWRGHERAVPSKRERKKLKRKAGEGEGEGEGDAANAEKGKEAKEEVNEAKAEEEGKTMPKRLPYPPRICLHSYSGSPATLLHYFAPDVPVAFYASFSTAVNLGGDFEGDTPDAFAQVVRAVPDDRVLVESDLHYAGEDMDRALEDMAKRICGVKGWGLEEGVERLGRNWRGFVFGQVGEE